MCMEDIRVMRESDAGQLIVSVTTASRLLVGESSKRVSLVIGCPDTNDVTISLHNPVVAGEGLRLQAGQSPLCLDIQKHGTLVTKGFYAITGAGTENICVLETFLNKD